MMERPGGGGTRGRPSLLLHTISVSELAQAAAARGRDHIDGGNERNRVLITEICSETSLDHKSQIHQSC